jgi:hypothetical protein
MRGDKEKWITALAERIDAWRVLVVRNCNAADPPLGERPTVRSIRPIDRSRSASR